MQRGCSRQDAHPRWRNLGRDDRCIADHGREARFPFLDEDVVAYISSLPLATIADLSRPPGEGDKLVLRRAAAMAGLAGAAGQVQCFVTGFRSA